MAERKIQSRFVPVQLRFRTPNKHTQEEREQERTTNGIHKPSDLPLEADRGPAQRRARQIKELLRLGKLLRADLGLEEVLQQIAASTATCTGFRVLVVNLIEENQRRISSVAFAGLLEDEQHLLREAHDPLDKIVSMMR